MWADLDEPARGEVWFRSEKLPGIRVRLAILLDGTVTSFEVHVEGSTERAHPVPPELEMPPMADASIGTRLVRDIPVGELAAIARAALRREVEQADSLAGTHGVEWPHLATQTAALRGEAKRPGRRGRPDLYYAELAVTYEAWLDGPDRPSLDVLAEQMFTTTSALRAALNVARTKGLLTAAPKGRAGGRATDKAMALIARSGHEHTEEE